ncbi:hypothetical protein HNR17_001875 [Galbitalea soli]|nr:hypothetical protein [Galbitalea soli]
MTPPDAVATGAADETATESPSLAADAPDSVPETAGEPVAESVPEAVTATSIESAPEAAAGSAGQDESVTAADAAPEIAPESAADASAEQLPEPAPVSFFGLLPDSAQTRADAEPLTPSDPAEPIAAAPLDPGALPSRRSLRAAAAAAAAGTGPAPAAVTVPAPEQTAPVVEPAVALEPAVVEPPVAVEPAAAPSEPVVPAEELTAPAAESTPPAEPVVPIADPSAFATPGAPAPQAPLAEPINDGGFAAVQSLMAAEAASPHPTFTDVPPPSFGVSVPPAEPSPYPAGDPLASVPSVPAPPAAQDWGIAPSETRSRSQEASRPSAATASAWIIAISPLLAAGAVGYLLATTGIDFLSGLPQAAAAIPYILVLILALVDRRQLEARGFENPAAWTWSVLTAPIYLLMRNSSLRSNGVSSVGPLVGWFVAVIVSFVGIVGYGLLTGKALIPGFPG